MVVNPSPTTLEELNEIFEREGSQILMEINQVLQAHGIIGCEVVDLRMKPDPPIHGWFCCTFWPPRCWLCDKLGGAPLEES